jgi:hypothetical protein
MIVVNDNDVQAWIDAGYSRPDAVAWIEAGCTVEDAEEWYEEGFNASNAAEWKTLGCDPKLARGYMRSGVDQVSAYYWRKGQMGGGTIHEAIFELCKRTKVYRAITSYPSRLHNTRQLTRAARAWGRRDFSPEETKEWITVGMDLNQSSAWRNAGFTPKDALKWSALESNPSAAAERRNEVMSADERGISNGR